MGDIVLACKSICESKIKNCAAMLEYYFAACINLHVSEQENDRVFATEL
jgi:hypothetical protein